MTVSELYNSVAQLGFEDSLEDDDRFIYAANRALLQVNAIRPATSAYIINHMPLKNKVIDSKFDPIENTDELFFYAENVKSYYFEADGKGTLVIEKKEADSWVQVGFVELTGMHGFKSYRGFIKQDGEFFNAPVRLRFTGEYIYFVRCVAMYEHLYSDVDTDIPAYEPYTRYDISELVTDFLALSSPLIIESSGLTYMNQGYSVENGRAILLPHDANGLYKVTYNRIPQRIDDEYAASNNTAKIDLDEDLCTLLPILIASYIWLDDEPEKAQYYLMLYKERAIEIERKIYNATPVLIENTNGW
jgi:hypothetical protein